MSKPAEQLEKAGTTVSLSIIPVRGVLSLTEICFEVHFHRPVLLWMDGLPTSELKRTLKQCVKQRVCNDIRTD